MSASIPSLLQRAILAHSMTTRSSIPYSECFLELYTVSYDSRFTVVHSGMQGDLHMLEMRLVGERDLVLPRWWLLPARLVLSGSQSSRVHFCSVLYLPS